MVVAERWVVAMDYRLPDARASICRPTARCGRFYAPRHTKVACGSSGTGIPGALPAAASGTAKAGVNFMARYGKKAQNKVKRAMHERKEGTLRSGRSGRKVKSRKQAIAIGLSEARRAGGKVPRKTAGRKSSRKKK
jgi:hypothetical protein